MVYGDLQFFDIIIFAAIAVFLIYRLRGVLGKRSGFEKNIKKAPRTNIKKEKETKSIPPLNDSEQKLETIYAQVENFDHKSFLEGAKKAFEIIITAFNNGDKKTLKTLVSKDVYDAFGKAIDENKNNPSLQFYSLVVDGVEDAKIDDQTIKISVNFTSEQIANNDEGNIAKNKDTWTFEKKVFSKNNAWTLSST